MRVFLALIVLSWIVVSLDISSASAMTRKTWVINGLGSTASSIGYGFTNLSKKIPGSILYNYTSMVQGSTVIRKKIINDVKAAYKKNRRIRINLIGFSFGANIASQIAAALDKDNIPVNYLATIEGPLLTAVKPNVKKADNFSCTKGSCFRTSLKLASGNNATRLASYKIDARHIPTGDHKKVHSRILKQIRN